MHLLSLPRPLEISTKMKGSPSKKEGMKKNHTNKSLLPVEIITGPRQKGLV